MKKQIITAAFIHCALASSAQAPQAIPYQAIARNSSGTIVASSPVGLRFSIHDSSPTGTVLYTETHTPTTSDQGSFNVNIGQGSVTAGTFTAINWSTNAKYLQVELDVAGGTSYVDMGTQQLLSVPYALYAESAGGSGSWADSAGMLHNTNTTKRVGIGTSNPQARLHVADSSVVFTGPTTLGSSPEPVPVTGTGSRFMWVPQKSSLRAGFAYGTQWNADSIGVASIAMGDGPTASGTNAIAMGHLARAKANNAVAIGDSASALGVWATALGRNVRTQGENSLVLGNNNSLGIYKGIAIGNNISATGENLIGVGNYITSPDVWTSGIALGNNIGLQPNSIIIGSNPSPYGGDGKINIGRNNSSYRGTIIGTGGYVSGGIVLGTGVDQGWSTVVGSGRGDGGGAEFAALGSNNHCLNGVGIGENELGGRDNTSIGVGNSTLGTTLVAIGHNAHFYLSSAMDGVAIGNNVEASSRSIIFGTNASNNGYEGSMIIGTGDSPSAPFMNTTYYQMAMKFSGGYKFFTDASCTIGAEIAPGGNSWSVISDKRKKEQIVPVQGNNILGKIKVMSLGSWNYIGQSPETFRHYGPMAQDFYAAFGKDDVGTIGNDTTINQADMAGVTFAAVQALVKKVEELTKQNEQLAIQNCGLKAELQKTNAELQKTKTDVDSRLEQMEMMIRQQQTAKK